MLQKLIEISQYYGNNQDYIIAGGGNTSYKDNENLWIKASGVSLKTIDEDGFVRLSRKKLQVIEEREYSSDNVTREQEVKVDLYKAIIDSDKRPSVETSLHNILDYAYVVHTHPTLINGLLCSSQAKAKTISFFGDKVLFIGYTDPGYVLFKKVLDEIKVYKSEFGHCPKIIFLENHGVFITADTTDEIKELYESINEPIYKTISVPIGELETSSLPEDTVNAISSDKSFSGRHVLGFRGKVVDYFVNNPANFRKINIPFTPDHIVYCKSKYLYLENSSDLDKLGSFAQEFKDRYGYDVKVIAIKDLGLFTADDSQMSANTVFEVFYDMIKIAYFSEKFGGPHPMTESQIEFIDNWEVENYRRQMAKR